MVTPEESEIALQVRSALGRYLEDSGCEMHGAVHETVVGWFEKPLLETLLAMNDGNLTRTADVLGLNRSTLRKKLRAHNLSETGASAMFSEA